MKKSLISLVAAATLFAATAPAVFANDKVEYDTDGVAVDFARLDLGLVGDQPVVSNGNHDFNEKTEQDTVGQAADFNNKYDFGVKADEPFVQDETKQNLPLVQEEKPELNITKDGATGSGLVQEEKPELKLPARTEKGKGLTQEAKPELKLDAKPEAKKLDAAKTKTGNKTLPKTSAAAK